MIRHSRNNPERFQGFAVLIQKGTATYIHVLTEHKSLPGNTKVMSCRALQVLPFRSRPYKHFFLSHSEAVKLIYYKGEVFKPV